VNYLLDACALIALVSAEEGGAVVRDLLERAEYGEDTIFMCRINLLEVYYGILRDFGNAQASEFIGSFRASVIQLVDPLEDDTIFFEAGRLKSVYKISLADAIALAYASIMKCTLVTADHHEMDIIDEKEDILFCWIR
jgi:predicted nucleic acid-binding protein